MADLIQGSRTVQRTARWRVSGAAGPETRPESFDTTIIPRACPPMRCSSGDPDAVASFLVRIASVEILHVIEPPLVAMLRENYSAFWDGEAEEFTGSVSTDAIKDDNRWSKYVPDYRTRAHRFNVAGLSVSVCEPRVGEKLRSPLQFVQFRASVRKDFSTVAPAARERASGSGGVEIGMKKK